MVNDSIEIALLIDSKGIRLWGVKALRKLVTNRDVKITYVVVNKEHESRETEEKRALDTVAKYFSKVCEHGSWTPIALWNFVHSPPEYYQQVDPDTISFLQESEFIHCRPEPADGIGNILPKRVIREINSADIVIRFGFGIIKGDILEAEKHGVLSFHHGDVRQYRGRPPGLWEFLNNEDEVGITLQRLNETLDSGEIVAFKSIDIRKHRTWQSVRTELMNESEDMLVRGLDNLCEGDVYSPNEYGDLYGYPGWVTTIRYVIKNSIGKLKNFVECI